MDRVSEGLPIRERLLDPSPLDRYVVAAGWDLFENPDLGGSAE
jgi:hypothetical protein